MRFTDVKYEMTLKFDFKLRIDSVFFKKTGQFTIIKVFFYLNPIHEQI